MWGDLIKVADLKAILLILSAQVTKTKILLTSIVADRAIISILMNSMKVSRRAHKGQISQASRKKKRLKSYRKSPRDK